jgi:signal transduction histidine kinase/DNA-binding response OmpR family regulator
MIREPQWQRLNQLVEQLDDRPQQAAEIRGLLGELREELDRSRQRSERTITQLSHAGRLIELGTMAAAVFHEMNQPLLGIKGFAELIQENTGGGDPAKLVSWAHEIRKQVQRLQQMQRHVTDFLRPQPADAGQPTELRVALDEAFKLFEHRIEKKKIALGVNLPDGLPPVRIERQQLSQILINLIGNAVDALEGQTERSLRIVARGGSGQPVRMLIADSGSGIPAGVRERLFEPFCSSKGERGSGLGLYIAQRLAEQSGGELRLIDPARLRWKQPPSTAFELQLPVAETEAGAEPAAPAAPPHDPAAIRTRRQLTEQMQQFGRTIPVSRRVLVVDDEEVIRRILGEFFAGQSILADVVSSSEEALDKLEQVEYAAVVTDKNLPGIDGIELLERIKQRWPRVEVLIITGYASVESALSAIELGAFDYIPKPFPSLGLVGNKVRGALDRHAFEQKVHAMIAFMTNTVKALQAERGAGADERVAGKLREMLDRYHAGQHAQGRVLVVGPEGLAAQAGKLGLAASRMENLEQALQEVRAGGVQVLVYLEAPGQPDGADVVQRLQQIDPGVGVLLIAREGNLNRIVAAMGMGVGDYLIHPVEGREMFDRRLQRLVARQQQVQRYRNLIEALKEINVSLMAEQ